VVYDQTNRYFYYRTYNNQNVRRIDLKKLSFKKGSERMRIELFGGDTYIDDTNRLMSTKK
jgi:hypothetical protein